MRMLFRLAIGVALLAGATVATVGPTFAANAPAHSTITVTCSNGFSRTVSAKAARGVAMALTQFNAHNNRNITCSAAPGAPRTRAASFVQVSCTNGFARDVNAKAANVIVKALNAYSTRKHLGVTCSIV